MKKEFKKILERVGEDPYREGLKKTPERASEAFKFFTSGYVKSLKEVVNGAIFNEKSNNMVLLKDIGFYSLCEHHLLPFFGKCHIGYIPNGKVIGLSKLPRIVNMYARRLQLQERITAQIADALNKVLKPKGVAVVMEANHMCMMMRGVQKEGSKTLTSSVLGSFAKNRKTGEEFLKLIGKK
jgi:GTP cyclohydrolase IA